MKDVQTKQLMSQEFAEDEILRAYTRKISKFPLLTQKQEIEFARLAQSGDPLARKLLVQGNLRLVLNIAKKSIHVSKLPLIDLIQEGNIALIASVDKFDWTLGYKFSTYASWWIKQAMFKAISEQAYSMKIPVYIQETLSKYRKVKAQMEQKFNCEVTSYQVADKMHISRDKIDNYLNAFTTSLSIETHYEDDNEKNLSLSELIEDKKSNVSQIVINKELKHDISTVLDFLKIKEKDVIKKRFGIEGEKSLTLQEIGNMYGVTKECIRQIEKKAIKKLFSDFAIRNILSAYVG